MTAIRTLLLLPVLLAVTGCGVTASSFNPGYASYERPQGSGLHRETQLSLGPAVLRLAARFVDDDPETQALLRALDGVRVTVYTVDPETDRQALGQAMADSARKLTRDSWEATVQVAEPDSHVHVLTRSDGDRLLGLAVMALDEEELVYVNVMGAITPEQLAELTETLSIDGDAISALALDAT